MKEINIFRDFLDKKGLKSSKPRDWILEAFLELESHVTVDEIWAAVKTKHPSVGFATVYRTLKLLCESGLCKEITFNDGTKRYEHLFEHSHHDHLICIKCGKCIEVFSSEIETLQNELMQKHGFIPKSHLMNLYGICSNCVNNVNLNNNC